MYQLRYPIKNDLPNFSINNSMFSEQHSTNNTHDSTQHFFEAIEQSKPKRSSLMARQPSPQPSPLNTVARMAQKDVQLASGDSGNLRVSRRSGRVLKQPLQSWTGERIVYDVDGNPVAAHAPTTKAPSKPDVDERLVSATFRD